MGYMEALQQQLDQDIERVSSSRSQCETIEVEVRTIFDNRQFNVSLDACIIPTLCELLNAKPTVEFFLSGEKIEETDLTFADFGAQDGSKFSAIEEEAQSFYVEGMSEAE